MNLRYASSEINQSFNFSAN